MHVALRSQTTIESDRIGTQILPRLRIIVPIEIVREPAFLIRPLPRQSSFSMLLGRQIRCRICGPDNSPFRIFDSRVFRADAAIQEATGSESERIKRC
jgi:hypothetical protein